jgi:hypothetical protein
MADDPKKKPDMGELSPKFVWDEDDVGSLTIDNSQAEGEPFDFSNETSPCRSLRSKNGERFLELPRLPAPDHASLAPFFERGL